MRKWHVSLDTSTHSALKALAPEIVPLIAAADAALEAKALADQRQKQFREVGERREYFDKVNAARKSLYGELSSLPHKVTGLPSGFADQFFRRDKGDADDATMPSRRSKRSRQASTRWQRSFWPSRPCSGSSRTTLRRKRSRRSSSRPAHLPARHPRSSFQHTGLPGASARNCRRSP
jgi:hypothetical protein